MRNDGLIKTMTAGGALIRYGIVKWDSSDGSVVQAAAATDSLMGVLADPEAATSGDQVDVQLSGIAEVVLGGTVTRGALVTADSAGKGVAAAPAAGVNNQVIGRAMTSGVSGDVIGVLLAPGQIQGA